MSDYEEDDYGAIESGVTSVLLGFSGRTAAKSDLTVLGNHIGGTPVWFRNTPPPSGLTNCDVCSRPADLLCQLSCPLPDKDYDRSIYVFACSDPNCRRKEGSVLAIRGVESNAEVKARIQAESEETTALDLGVPQSSLGGSLFGAPEGAESASAMPMAANPFLSPQTAPAAAKPAKSKKKKSKKKEPVAGKYPCKLLEVEDEYIEPQSTEELMKGVKIETDQDDTGTAGTSGSGSGSGGSEASDLKALEATTDAAFMHFVEIVECNPEQVLRYERGLKPLLYGLSDGVPEQLRDLKSRTLEVQLMPHLIAELETKDMIADGMEWGTIFVATEATDKLPELDSQGVGYSREWVAVQWE